MDVNKKNIDDEKSIKKIINNTTSELLKILENDGDKLILHNSFKLIERDYESIILVENMIMYRKTIKQFIIEKLYPHHNQTLHIIDHEITNERGCIYLWVGYSISVEEYVLTITELLKQYVSQ